MQIWIEKKRYKKRSQIIYMISVFGNLCICKFLNLCIWIYHIQISKCTNSQIHWYTDINKVLWHVLIEIYCAWMIFLHFLERIVLSVLIYVWHFSSTALLREIIWVLNQGKIGPFFYLQGIPDAWLGKINFILYVASGLFTEKIFQSHFILINYTTWLNFRPCRPLFRKSWNYL